MRPWCWAILCLIGGATALLAAPEERPRSILVLDQSDVRGPFYYQVFSGLRTFVNAKAASSVTIYVESLDLSRFSGPAYEASLRRHFEVKYRDKPIGVIVAIGSATLEYVLRGGTPWQDLPVVFAMVDEATFARLKPSSNVTGTIMKLRLSDMVASARAIVPDLKTIAFVGDAWETQTSYRHWKDEIPVAAKDLEIVDLTGLKMRNLRERVAQLPDRSAIVYSAIYSDGEGTFFPPADAIALVAEAANRPIVVSAETFIGRGGTGGYVMMPALIGEAAARLALRVLEGESPANIPAVPGDIVRPVFDWREMQRWNVSPASLPAHSEFRFRVPSIWQQYRWLIAITALVLLLETMLIAGLIYERRRRQNAEIEARERLSELAHVNRRATVGEMSSSIVHEINQPLGAILTNAEAAELILEAAPPNVNMIKAILTDIKRDNQRASQVLLRLRGLLRKTDFETQEVDLNAVVRESLDCVSPQASARNIILTSALEPEALWIKADRVQIQQVLVNLLVNSMDAMVGNPREQRKIIASTVLRDNAAEVSIADFGHGIPTDTPDRIFEPFYTTKEDGLGMGLSIARNIVQAHQGQIWAENQANGGAVFRFSLPLIRTRSISLTHVVHHGHNPL